jgi:hypothetical protein
VVGQGEIPTTTAGFQRLIGDHALPPGTPVTLETGTVAFFVARELTARGLVPSVIEAASSAAKLCWASCPDARCVY